MSRTKRTDKVLYCAIEIDGKGEAVFRVYRALTLLDVRDYIVELGNKPIVLATSQVFYKHAARYYEKRVDNGGFDKEALDRLTLYKQYRNEVSDILNKVIEPNPKTGITLFELECNRYKEVYE